MSEKVFTLESSSGMQIADSVSGGERRGGGGCARQEESHS